MILLALLSQGFPIGFGALPLLFLSDRLLALVTGLERLLRYFLAVEPYRCELVITLLAAERIHNSFQLRRLRGNVPALPSSEVKERIVNRLLVYELPFRR